VPYLPHLQPPCPLVLLLRPHIAILSRTTTSNVHARFMSSVFSPLLSALTVGSSNVDEDSQRPLKRNRSDQPVYPHIILGSCTSSASTQASIQELKADLLSALFRSAADPAANEVDRRKIYQVWREQGGDDEED
jgi:ribosomal RNA-processing protein 1